MLSVANACDHVSLTAASLALRLLQMTATKKLMVRLAATVAVFELLAWAALVIGRI